MSSDDGRIELIIGPMFAGKTTTLMQRVKQQQYFGRKCCVVKYAKDTRYAVDSVASHSQLRLKAHASVQSLREMKEEMWIDFDVIAIDEGQFFDDIVTFSRTAADLGKIVIISALDGDFLRRPFTHIAELIPLSEKVDKLTAVCMLCQRKEASFTLRTVKAMEQELIGGADMYVAACRKCYLEGVPPNKSTTATPTPAPEAVPVRETSPAQPPGRESGAATHHPSAPSSCEDSPGTDSGSTSTTMEENEKRSMIASLKRQRDMEAESCKA